MLSLTALSFCTNTREKHIIYTGEGEGRCEGMDKGMDKGNIIL